MVNVLGFSLPFYRSPTLLLSLGLSVRVLYYLITQRPDVIHVSSPGLLVFAATLYAKLLAIPLVVSCAGPLGSASTLHMRTSLLPSQSCSMQTALQMLAVIMILQHALLAWQKPLAAWQELQCPGWGVCTDTMHAAEEVVTREVLKGHMPQVSYHTHIPEYIPKYTWKGLVGPMWRVIRFNILMADLTLVPSKTMKVSI